MQTQSTLTPVTFISAYLQGLQQQIIKRDKGSPSMENADCLCKTQSAGQQSGVGVVIIQRKDVF